MSRRLLQIMILVAIALLAVSVVAAQDDEEPAPPPGGTYIIEKGDTLDVLAQRWNISVEALLEENDLKSGRGISIGDTIRIPLDPPAYGVFPPLYSTAASEGIGGGGGGSDFYTMQPGDTLDKIAQAFDVSLASLLEANELTMQEARKLQAGTVVFIPSGVPAYDGLYVEASALGSGGGGGGDADDDSGSTSTVSGDIHVVAQNETLDSIAADYNVQTDCLAEANNLENPRWLYVGDELVIDRTCPPYDGFDFVGDK